MNFYLPIAEISINIYLLISLGVGIGFISGLFGIGGGFISSPVLILFGIPPSVAVGTTTVQVFASTSTGVLGHYQKKISTTKWELQWYSGVYLELYLEYYF